VSDSSRSASTIARLRSTAASRINDSLLTSNGKVAGIGLATALLTLAFTIWFRTELNHQAEYGAPLARAATELDSAINASISSLRGWVAYGDPAFAEERAATWSQRIEPSIGQLRDLAQRGHRPEVAEQVKEISHGLRDLARVQWAIEDVARTPGNQPASVAYRERLEPLRRSVLRHTGNLIENEAHDSTGEYSVQIVGRLSRFRTRFVETDLALIELLSDYDAARDHELDVLLMQTGESAERIRTERSAQLSGDELRMLDFTLGEFDAYAAQVRQVIALRKSDQWNVALQLFVTEAQPAAERVREVADRLAVEQTAASTERTQSLAEASNAVIAMALVMGLISAGSLMVSFRLRRQVQDVMVRAKKLGQYVIDGRLGSGGMGDVYLAHHAMLRRPTAIKLLRADSAQDLRAQSRFQREVQSTSHHTHPNTVVILDYCRKTEGVFYKDQE
jgi:hypothetical protein